MPTTYVFADSDVMGLVKQVMRDWHGILADAEVLVGVLFAHDETGPAIKRAGVKVMGSIRVVPLKDRLAKRYDAEMLLDAEEWGRATEKQRLALLDHELSHLRARFADGVVMRDALRRPMLKVVCGDWNPTDGFRAVVQRHGANSYEQRAYKRIYHEVITFMGVEIEVESDSAAEVESSSVAEIMGAK